MAREKLFEADTACFQASEMDRFHSEQLTNFPRCLPGRRALSIFLEVNPEAVLETAFKRGLPHAGGGVDLVERDNISEDLKARTMAKFLNAGRKSVKGVPERGFTSLIPLANPKGVVKHCEMCSLPGRMCCLTCGVTYYCSDEHQRQDTSHASLCLRLSTIRGKSDAQTNKMSRLRDLAQRNLVTASLLEETFCNAVENLYGGNVESATVEFQTCLFVLPKAYGMTTCQAITLFVFMSDAFVTEKRLNMARDSLAMATYELRQLEEAEEEASLDYTKALLFKSQGRIDLEEKKYQDATFHFAECVYYSAEAFGGYHVRVCAGYYYLGKAFFASERTEQGFYTLAFCTDLWMAYLQERFLASVPEDEGGDHKPMFAGREESAIPRFLELEANHQLNGIEEATRDEQDVLAFLKTTACLGVLHFFRRDYSMAKAKADYVLQNLVGTRDRRLEQLVKRLSRISGRR